MAVRQAQVFFGPYQATFNAVDIGSMEDFEVAIETKTASVELINGITIKRDVNRSLTVTVTLAETSGLKTALAALFPGIYTTSGSRGQLLWGVSTCGSIAAPQNLVLSADCDTGTDEDLIFYGARPNLEAIEVPGDSSRKVRIRFEIEGISNGNFFQIGSTV